MANHEVDIDPISTEKDREAYLRLFNSVMKDFPTDKLRTLFLFIMNYK